MTIASILQDENILYRQPPANLEAEQALLGALLVNNESLNHVGDFLRAEHFCEPIHARIFEAIGKCFNKGQIATPVTLKHYFDRDEALENLGGAQYLARLAGAATTILNVTDVGRVIYDLALKRKLIELGEEVVNTAYAHDLDIDASAQIESAEQKLFTLAVEGSSERSFEPLRTSLHEALKRAEAAFMNPGGVVGVTTGLVDMDRLLGGLQRSDLVILAGRPSMGKTALATTMAFEASRAFAAMGEGSGSVAFFSLEMSGEQLAGRMLANAANINSNKLRKGDLTREEFDRLVRASVEINALPFYIDDTPALSISALRTRARRLKRMHNLQLIVVDYLQLMRGSAIHSTTGNRVQEVSEITQGLKAIAKELDVPVIALSQLSRAVEQRDDKRPQLSDLRESGSIEQDADVVMFVFREEYYVGRKEPRIDSPKYAEWQAEMEAVHGIAEVIIAKQRHGPIGNVRLNFHSDTTSFRNLAHPDHTPAYHD